MHCIGVRFGLSFTAQSSLAPGSSTLLSPDPGLMRPYCEALNILKALTLLRRPDIIGPEYSAPTSGSKSITVLLTEQKKFALLGSRIPQV
jgi:hypothetical protein